jgi:undecaprenyl-diphosphatase
MAVHLLLQPALLTNGLKLLTGRPRPVHLGALGEGFVPFHVLHPGLGDFSFPSGHVAVTMILAPVVLVLFREGRRSLAGLVALSACAWTGTVAFGRVAFGAHFPTDVLASLGLGLALAPLSALLGARFARWLDRRPVRPG